MDYTADCQTVERAEDAHADWSEPRVAYGQCTLWAQHGQPGQCHQAEPHGRGCSMDGCLKHHHRPEHFAPLHLVKRLFNFIQSNGLRYKPFEVEPAL